MKKIIFLAALALSALQLLAADVDVKTAQQVAQRFMMSHAAASGRFMASAPTVKWTHAEKNSSKVNQTTYYIVNTDNGYVIVSGDDRAKEILAYGEGSLSSINDLPEAVQYFLDIYQKQMEYLQAHPGMVVQKLAATRGTSIEPLLKTAWAQGKPYNMRCPRVGRDYCQTGCTATSLAQVMKYWEYPEKAPDMAAYTCKESGIHVPALGEYTFDWENMWDTYEAYSSNTDQLPDVNKDAIAYLMRYVGQAEQVDYNVERTGTENLGILGAIRLFGYDEGAYIKKKYDSPDYQGDTAHDGHEFYNDEQWGEQIQAELRAGRPLVYCAYDMSSDSSALGGHAFNVDGYDAETDMYHVNFGMRSERNTYYALNAFRIDDFVVYDFWPIFFAGVQPPGYNTDPRILVSPNELNMECYAGEDTTATFNVVGEKLSGDITVALDDANGVFTVDVTTIAVVDSFANVTVTVTYAPQAAGTHSATITLSSDGVESKVVTLNGTATNAPLVLFNPVMLPADSAYINLTSFRADWTDQTVPQNVLSYTLEVKEKPSSGGVLAEVDFSDIPQMSGNQASHATDFLPEGWGFNGYDFYFDEAGFVELSGGDYIMTNALDMAGNDKVTVVVRAKNYYTWGNSRIDVSTSVETKTIELAADVADYTVVLDCGSTEKIKFTANGGMLNLQSIKVYAGEVTAPQLRATETGDAAYRLIEGITDKFYTVTGLNAESTYTYKVKALYADNTESAWSNTQMVTLFENGPALHEFAPGDVNHDRAVDVNDVTTVISSILGNDEGICPICANVNGDDAIDVLDVTMIIGIILNAN